ncbi:MAG: ABC transporter permease [archaeon]
MIGIFIGIATVVALISVGQGFEAAINEQFEMMGSDKVMVMPGGFGPMGAFPGNPLMDSDLEVVRDTDGVEDGVGMFYRTGRVTFKDETRTMLVIGLPTGDSAEILSDMQGFEAKEGRDLRDGDNYKVVVGWSYWNGEIFEKSVGIRDNLVIEDKKFEVVGLMKKIGNPQDDSQIYVPVDTARELFDGGEELDSIFVQVKPGYEPEEVAEDIEEELRDHRGEDEDEESFTVQTFAQLMEQIGLILAILRVVLVGIAGISLVVGGIGIMNTMYTAVIERTREIGIMKAIGARNSDVMLLFLLESGAYGLVGGIIGVIVGLGLSFSIQQIAGMFIGTGLFKAHISLWLVVGALLFSFVVGTVSGVLPARQASSLKPVDALRYE